MPDTQAKDTQAESSGSRAAEKTGEYAGLSPEQINALKRVKDAYEVSEEFVRPYFGKFRRMNDLYHDVIPSELDCTYSKIMLSTAFAIVQNEIPRAASMLFSREEFFRLHASDPYFEDSARAVQAWLEYQARERNRIFPRILSTLTRQSVYGTAFRAITHSPRVRHKTRRVPSQSVAGIPMGFTDEKEEETSLGIHAQNIDVWNVLPSPNARFVNQLDNEDFEAAEWMLWIDYMSGAKLRKMSGKRGMDEGQIKAMFDWVKKGGCEEQTVDEEFKQQVYPHDGAGGGLDDNVTDWMQRLRSGEKPDIEKRYRCMWAFFRDKWYLIGEGRFVLYDGPPLLDWFPIAAYSDTPDPDSIYGTGLIEKCEDIILSKHLNVNHRHDYLAGTLHPSSFIRDDIIRANGGNTTDFDPAPYQTFSFPKTVTDIQRAVLRDRFPDISPQAFQEATAYAQELQDVTGQTDYMKGRSGAGALSNETATGITALIDEASNRVQMRSLNLEYGGLHDELMLMLKWGAKYAFDDEYIRIASRKGFPWMTVPHEAITDGYGIELVGSRQLVHRGEMLKRLITVLPMFMNNPNVPGQGEMMRQVNEKFELFDNPDQIFAPSGGGGMLPAAAVGNPAAGMGGAQTMGNDIQAVQGATAMPPASLAV